jgi:hypothetical protein
VQNATGLCVAMCMDAVQSARGLRVAMWMDAAVLVLGGPLALVGHATWVARNGGEWSADALWAVLAQPLTSSCFLCASLALAARLLRGASAAAGSLHRRQDHLHDVLHAPDCKGLEGSDALEGSRARESDGILELSACARTP